MTGTTSINVTRIDTSSRSIYCLRGIEHDDDALVVFNSEWAGWMWLMHYSNVVIVLLNLATIW